MATRGAATLRSRIAAHSGRARGNRYPDDLKQAAGDWAAAAVQAGTSLQCAAGQLGVPGITLKRWMDGTPASTFHDVILAGRGPGSGGISVHVGRVRVDGLSADDVAHLVERLVRCGQV